MFIHSLCATTQGSIRRPQQRQFHPDSGVHVLNARMGTWSIFDLVQIEEKIDAAWTKALMK